MSRGLRIGEFARRCRLPVSALRYYDRIGLLSPAAVDPATGYRTYAAAQVPAAALVARLRAAGIGPAAIAAVLAGGADGTAALRAERRRIAAELDVRARALAEVDDLLAAPPPAPAAAEPVTLTTGPVAVHAYAGAVADLPGATVRAVAALRLALRRDGRRPVGPWGALLPLDLDDPVRAHAFVRLDADPDAVSRDVLPAGPAMRVEAAGTGQVALTAAYDAALAAVDRIGGRPAGPVVEEYPGLGTTARPTVVVQVRYRPLP